MVSGARAAGGLVVLAALVTSMLVLAGCREPPAPARRQVTIWRPIGNWTGSGSTQTEAFIGESGAFRVRWETKSGRATAGGSFKVLLHSSVSGRPLLTVVERDGAGSGEAHVTEDPREFFLVIEATNLEWSIALDEAVRAWGPADTAL